jgi:NADH dehydrogenase (ubiquinone) flavoprotein 1
MISRVFARVFRFSTEAPKKTYGGLKDQDRIFTNLYRDGDPFVQGALKRVRFQCNPG